MILVSSAHLISEKLDVTGVDAYYDELVCVSYDVAL